MIENIKTKLWHFLEKKEVSLALIVDGEGRILWHRGRNVRGDTVATARGFSRSSLETAIHEGGRVEADDITVSLTGDQLPASAKILYIRSLLVLPLAGNIFLYLDSGSRDAFTPADREVFRFIGELLTDVLRQIRQNETGPGGFTGSGEASRRVRDLIARYALFEYPVLLVGETGTGKTHVAELIHRFSGRKGPYTVVHTPSLPENLLESELFGHRRGAFTDAREDKRGLVELSEGGTLFLDEIAELSDACQAKLLHFIETRRYRVLGDAREREADVRIVAATHRDLAALAREGKFRPDLFYRLDVLRLVIPPLRERREDIRDLVNEHRRFLMGKELGPEAWEALLSHSWPGNVRDLVHVLQRAGVQLDGPVIGREIQRVIRGDAAAGTADAPARWDEIRSELTAGKSFWETAWEAFLERHWNRRELRRFLQEESAACGGNLKQLAERLNVDDYPRFVSALHKYGIHPVRG